MSLLAGLTQSAPGVSLYAPASGGGGGGGPNLNLSTLNMPFAASSTPLNVGSTASGNSFFGAGFTSGNDVQVSVYANQAGNAGGLEIVTDNANQIVTIGQLGNYDIVLENISTINGVPPGGGGGAGPNLLVSTMSVSSSGTVSMNENSVLNFTSTLIVNATNAPSAQDYVLTANTPDTGIVAGFGGAGNANVFSAFAPGNNARGLNFAACDSNASVIASVNSGNPSSLSIVADKVSIPFDSYISTITSQQLTTSTLVANGLGQFNNGLNMSNTTLQLTAPGIANQGVVYYNSGNSNVYLTNPSTGTLCLGTQSNAAAFQVGNNFVSIPDVGASISTLTVSSINGGPLPTPGTLITNNAYPFTTGSDNAGIWQVNVASNTSGNPQYLTASVTTNSSNSYLVNVNLLSGSNSDTATTSVTKLALALSGQPTDITLGSFPGFTNYWIYSGVVGPKTAIVRGASAIRLYAWSTSPTQGSELYFDTTTGMSITNLGPSS